MRLDTGADVTLLSNTDWIAMGRPTLRPPRNTLKSANDKPINFWGCYECNFVIDGHHGRDYSTGLNDALEQHQHPLPTPDDIFTKLNGGLYFSQLDLAEAYLQLEVDDDSKQLLTIDTHRGLFRFNHPSFGVKPAPGIFQQCVDDLIARLDRYLDEILVTGKTIDETNTTLD
uniref:Peptidase A2 domain-containing protein n=1 Tax=Haemonchus contortus TaxID=6289 RepID=A0A7I4YQ79_HAECO